MDSTILLKFGPIRVKVHIARVLIKIPVFLRPHQNVARWTFCAFFVLLTSETLPLYTATFLSFVYAFGHFLTEYLVYQTMAIGNLTTVSIFAGIYELN